MPAQQIIPTAISQEQLDAICLAIVEEMSVRRACQAVGVAKSTFFFWLSLHASPAQLDQYSRAMHLRADSMLDDTADIADDDGLDYRFVKKDDESGESARALVNHEHISRSKLRVETRFKLAEKMNPRKYGALVKTEVTGADGGPVEMTRADDAIIAQTLALLARKDG